MSQSLTALLDSPGATLDAVSALLDGAADDAARLQLLSKTTRKQQRRLYQLAERAPAVTLEDMVPAAVAPLTAIRHVGRNTLPLPGALRAFEKRFCRPSDGSARLFGYNEGATRPLIGPGYYVAYPTDADVAWQKRGPLVVDYFRVPDGAVVKGWPKVVPNSHGLQFFVFRGTRDFMRKVSSHVTVGAAYKGEKALDHYFTLCRLEA